MHFSARKFTGRDIEGVIHGPFIVAVILLITTTITKNKRKKKKDHVNS